MILFLETDCSSFGKNILSVHVTVSYYYSVLFNMSLPKHELRALSGLEHGHSIRKPFAKYIIIIPLGKINV